MKEKFRGFLQKNFIPLLFVLCVIITEMTAVYVTSGGWRIRKPWVFLAALTIITAVQYLFSSNRMRHVYSCVLLSVLVFANLVFVVLYEMTGTIFDYSMLNLRRDAMAILESIPLNFGYVSATGICLSFFIVFGRAFDNGKSVAVSKLASRVIALCLAAGVLCYSGLIRHAVAESADSGALVDQLYEDSVGGYADVGVLGNFLTELHAGIGHEVEVGDLEEIAAFLYEKPTEPTPMFGAAKDYNVVTVLSESLEWFAFVKNEALYPNGHTLDEETLRTLYPNFYELAETSYVLTNFHGREKTDISENLSLLGNYPMKYYVNYDYPENNLAYSLPNLLKTLYGVTSYSFHNGTETFYNRNRYLVDAVGFADFISSEDMGSTEIIEPGEFGERNLDADMMETCKKQMFPTDRRFNTYITTITMHGQYVYRENLQPYYDILDAHGITAVEEDGTPEAAFQNAFRHYAATAMETDKAIGVMMDYLRETGLLEKTLIVFFSDHNVYYQSVSNYVKNIFPRQDAENLSELYHIPCFIKIGDQKEGKTVEKFTCTADLLPTTLDLLGIRAYENLFYGTSAFSQEESVLYSRAYDIFLTDHIYFTTMNNVLWQAEETDGAYVEEVFHRAAVLMEKYSYVNRMFAADFFRGEQLTRFEKNLRAMNR